MNTQRAALDKDDLSQVTLAEIDMSTGRVEPYSRSSDPLGKIKFVDF